MNNREIKVQFIAPRRWWQQARWLLLEDYTSANGLVNVPYGFITDGASIPLIARMLFSPTGRYFGAAIIHDYIIKNEGNYPKAHKEMGREMDALGIAVWRKFFILTGVKSWSIFLQICGKDILRK